ncbi:MAG: DivIVA domain-containing protein [Clostridiales bacterium]|nr:DivIVA domain-containing protein [Clostridiales bacterium]
MAVTKPDKLQKVELKKGLRGYEVKETDEYISYLLKEYAELYESYVKLSIELEEAKKRLENIDTESALVKQELSNARKAASKIVSDAYERADDILSSIKKNCDLILSSFRDKIEAQKVALAKIQTTIFQFKNELFEKYRLHIELIEKIAPIYEYEEDLSPDQYVDKVIDNLEREVASDFGMTLEDIASPTSQPKLKKNNANVDEALSNTNLFGREKSSKTIPSSTESPDSIADFSKPIPDAVRSAIRDGENPLTQQTDSDVDSLMRDARESKARRTRGKASEDVIQTLNRYEDSSTLGSSNPGDDVQLKLDFDLGSGEKLTESETDF